MATTLQTKYQSEIHKQLTQRFGYKNTMQVPKLEKIVISMGIGKAIENKSRVEKAAKDLGAIAGQKPVIRKAKKSVAGFKLRQGVPVGVSVTLRGDRMFEFLERFIHVVAPRIRDFRGLPKKFDGRGNYSVGLGEQTVFPEIDLDKVEFTQGMNITVVTTAKTDEEGVALLEGFGFPFRR
jgi:large subunit ribosomal protein L5